MNGATVLTKFTADTHNLDSGIRKVNASVSSIAKGVLVATGITKAFSAAWNMVTSNMDRAISRLDTMNNFPKVMSNLGISASDSQKAIDKLAEKLKGIPTTLDQAALSVQRLTSKNGDIKKSTNMFLAMNNAILAGGTSSEIQASAIEQLSQAYAKGKPDMMEWRSMLQAMPAQLKQVATAMGYVDADALGEALREGTLSMDEFMEKLIEMNEKGVDGFKSFEEQARNATGGIATSITNMKTAVARGLANLINEVDKGLANTQFKSIGNILGKIGDLFDNGLTSIGKNIGGLIEGSISVEEIVNKILVKINKISSKIISRIPSFINSIASIIKSNLPTISKLIVETIGQLTLVLAKLLPQIVNFIKTILPQLMTTIKDIFGQIGKTVKILLPQIVEAIMDLIPILLENIPYFIDAGIDLIISLADGAVIAIPKLLEKSPEIITKLIASILTLVPKMQTIGPKLILSLAKGLIAALPTLIMQTPLMISAIIKGFLQGVSGMYDVGRQMISGLWRGLSGLKSWVINQVRAMGKSIIKSLRSVLGIHSPSKEFEIIGKFSVLGYTNQLEKMQDKVQSQIAETFQVSPQLANSSSLHYTPNIINNTYVDVKQDPLGQTVNTIKTFSGGSKQDYNYGMGV